MIDITFELNGTDYSNLLSTYEVTHEVEISDSMTSLDGTEHFAARKRPTLTVSFRPLTDAQTADIYSILSDITAEVTYTDPYLNDDRMLRMRVVSGLQSSFGLRSIDGNRYYKGGDIVLRSISCL